MNFHRIHRISYKKETSVHGFEPLTSCMSTTSYSTAPSVTYVTDISGEFKISVAISAVNICKIFFLAPKIFFHRILIVAVKFFFSPPKR